jgi:hypothetical protein
MRDKLLLLSKYILLFKLSHEITISFEKWILQQKKLNPESFREDLNPWIQLISECVIVII